MSTLANARVADNLDTFDNCCNQVTTSEIGTSPP